MKREKKEIKIRGLTVNDCRMLQSLMEKFIADSNDKWLSKLTNGDESEAESGSTDSGGGEMIALFVEIFQDVISKYHSEVTEWFSSLIGVTVEAYGELPFDTDMVIIEQISGAEEFTNFFRKALVVFKLKKIFGNGIEKAKEKFASTIGKPKKSLEKCSTLNITSEVHSSQKKKSKKKKRG